MARFPDEIEYSSVYRDDNHEFEYRHISLPKEIYKSIPKSKLLTESECAFVGIHQSPGWVNYAIHSREPFILLFRRKLK